MLKTRHWVEANPIVLEDKEDEDLEEETPMTSSVIPDKVVSRRTEVEAIRDDVKGKPDYVVEIEEQAVNEWSCEGLFTKSWPTLFPGATIRDGEDRVKLKEAAKHLLNFQWWNEDECRWEHPFQRHEKWSYHIAMSLLNSNLGTTAKLTDTIFKISSI